MHAGAWFYSDLPEFVMPTKKKKNRPSNLAMRLSNLSTASNLSLNSTGRLSTDSAGAAAGRVSPIDEEKGVVTGFELNVAIMKTQKIYDRWASVTDEATDGQTERQAQTAPKTHKIMNTNTRTHVHTHTRVVTK